MEAQVTFYTVRREENFPFTRQNHQEAIKRLRTKNKHTQILKKNHTHIIHREIEQFSDNFQPKYYHTIHSIKNYTAGYYSPSCTTDSPQERNGPRENEPISNLHFNCGHRTCVREIYVVGNYLQPCDYALPAQIKAPLSKREFHLHYTYASLSNELYLKTIRFFRYNNS